MIALERLRELLDYDSNTGIFRRQSGKIAGWANGNGYTRINIDGARYYSHRLAWFYIFGEWPQYIDHINGNPLDNRIVNLRKCSQSQNSANSRARSTLKLKGTSYRPSIRKWQAQITKNYKTQHLGWFDTPEAAHAAYLAAARISFGEFARAA